MAYSGITYSTRELARHWKRWLRRTPKRWHDAPDMGTAMPKTRGGCGDTGRPCPWIRCRYHLFMESMSHGSLKFPHGSSVEVLLSMPETCALDVAAQGAKTLEQVAGHLNVTRERARQEEEGALAKFQQACQALNIKPGTIDGLQQTYVEGPVDSTLVDLGLEDDAWMRRQLQSAMMTPEEAL